MSTAAPIGLRGTTQSLEETLDNIQSLSLSEKQSRLIVRSELDEDLSTYTYKNNISYSNVSYPLTIVRCAIKNRSVPTLEMGKLIGFETKIFSFALEHLQTVHSAEATIKERALNQPMILNNVILLDIYETKPDKETNTLKLQVDDKGAKIHTVCLWKKTDTQLMIIDPSSSEFSERLEKSVQTMLNSVNLSNVKCKIMKHLEEKFYKAPEGSEFSRKSTDSLKPRDCIDIALKIGIVLNEGTLIYNNVFKVQNSINLLSNQSLINPILGCKDDDTTLKHLQSTRMERRFAAISAFSSIPHLFKENFDYQAWEKFRTFTDEEQNSILSALRFNKKTEGKLFEGKQSDEKQFERLLKLSRYIDRYNELKRDTDSDNLDFTFKTKAQSFLPRGKK